jgi:YceI-like domain
LCNTLTFAQTAKWSYDAAYAKIGFTISHFCISETEGKFTKFDGTVLSGKTDFSDAKIDFIIDVNSINTEDVQRDTHWKMRITLWHISRIRFGFLLFILKVDTAPDSCSPECPDRWQKPRPTG